MSYCLVTGGAGFIGSHLVEKLLADGWKVRVLDNLSTGKTSNLKGVADRIEFIQGSINDATVLRPAVAGCELVFHLAALPSVARSLVDPMTTHEVCATGTSGAFLEPGYPPLYYSRDRSSRVSPNKTAVCAIGEAMAGFVAQRLYQCTKLARPNHDYPDVVMEGQQKTYLVEAKATLQSVEEGIEPVVNAELPRLASFTSSAGQLDVRPVVGLLIGTCLVSEIQYYCYMIELQLV